MPPCCSGSGCIDSRGWRIYRIYHGNEWYFDNAIDIDESWTWFHILWSIIYTFRAKWGMTDLTWNANHIYNLFKCWRYIPDRNIKKSGHGSNLRRGYQRFGDSSWNENLFHVQSFSSNIFIHVHPFSVHHFIPAHWHPIQVPSLLLTSSHDRAAIAHGSPVLGQGIRALCGVILIPPEVTPARWMDAKLRFMTYLLWTPQLD